MAATAPTARASRPTLEPSEEALRPEQSDQQIQREEQQEREPGRRQQRYPEGDAEQPQLGAAQPREEAVADEAVVAREAGHDGVLQQEQQADGGEDLRERIAALHAAHEGAIDEHAEAEHGEPERHDGEQRIQTEPGAEPPCAEHPEHEELAVGEVDHLHQAPDDRQAHRHEGVEKPHLKAVDDGLGELGHGAWRRSGSGLRRAVALLPARVREDRLEPGLAREVPRPQRVLLAVPADLRHHAGGERVLLVVVELDALVVDDQLLGRHVRLARGLGEGGRLDRPGAVDHVGHPQEARDLTHGQLARWWVRSMAVGSRPSQPEPPFVFFCACSHVSSEYAPLLVAITFGVKAARLASFWKTVVSAVYCTRNRTSGLAACRRCTSDASVVAPVLVVRSSTPWKPAFGARAAATLRLSWQKRLSQVNRATVLRSRGPPCSRHSFRNENTLATITLSWGPVRQNHFIPFSVSVGDAQGWHESGMPALSTTGWMIDVEPLVPSPLIQCTLLTLISCSTMVRAWSPRL